VRPIDLPPPSHWATRPHGTRLRYISGCRCVPCRAARSRYETLRTLKRAQGHWNGLVDALPARQHLQALSRQGMGYKRVARAAGVSITVVQLIVTGRRTQMRAQARRKILAVRLSLAPHALVPAGPTWVLLDALVAEGYPKCRLAWMLGYRGWGLQISRRQVTVKTAARVEALYSWVSEQASAAMTR
jgi:hypothetical protein